MPINHWMFKKLEEFLLFIQVTIHSKKYLMKNFVKEEFDWEVKI